MRKFRIILSISAVFIAMLVIGAFLYEDISGHKSFQYEQFVDNKLFAKINVGRYVTEDKIIYKSNAKYFATLEYPEIIQKIFLKRKNVLFQKFIEDAKGEKGRKRFIMLVQKGKETDFLFLEHPRFMSINGFETGDKTLVFQPQNILSYMPIVDRYNFWKKGTQSFEVMIPLPEEILPLRDKIKMSYFQNEYVTIMGSRVEAESFIVSARSIPDMKLVVAKYTRRVLSLESTEANRKFVLVKSTEGVEKKLEYLTEKLTNRLMFKKTYEDIPEKTEENIFSEIIEMKEDEKEIEGTNIFFDSGSLILSGKLFMPSGEGPHPAVCIVNDDGPVTGGALKLADFLSHKLSESGFMVLTFDDPGQGKSQGSVVGLDDEKRIANINAAVKYLEGQPFVKKTRINVLGYKGGGYLAVKAAEISSNINTCVVLGMPTGSLEKDIAKESMEGNIRGMFEFYNIGPFDKTFMEMVKDKVAGHKKEVMATTDRFSFFKGVRLPLKEYREFLARKSYSAIVSFDRPVLIIIGRDDRDFDDKVIDSLTMLFQKNKHKGKVAVPRQIGEYIGTMKATEDSWQFVMNKDALRFVLSWLKEQNPDTEAEIEAGEAVQVEIREGAQEI